MTAALLSPPHVDGRRVFVRIAEWQALKPGRQGQSQLLRGLSFGSDTQARTLAADLSRANVVSIVELRDGLSIQTHNYVGRVAVGPLDITIAPKITWKRWLPLVGFALRLRDVTASDRLTANVESFSLVDILVLQLVTEARDLIVRGLHRDYVRRREPLASPRGRIDFSRIAHDGGIRTPTIPCRHTRRSDDSPLNRALLAGLRFAASITRDAALRTDARRLARELEPSVSLVSLSDETLRAAHIAMDRRTARYSASLRLIELLKHGQSVTWEDGAGQQSVSVPGFALDMSRLWQRVLGRVLGEWNPEIEVREEFSLRGVFRSNPDYPFGRETPSPRPDFAVFRHGKLIGFFDAKYRDLTEHSLPRDMLYQLAIYAMAQGGGVATILYPTDSRRAVEQRLDISNPVTASVRGSVGLRPVKLDTLEALVTAPPSEQRAHGRALFAKSLVSV